MTITNSKVDDLGQCVDKVSTWVNLKRENFFANVRFASYPRGLFNGSVGAVEEIGRNEVRNECVK